MAPKRWQWASEVYLCVEPYLLSYSPHHRQGALRCCLRCRHCARLSWIVRFGYVTFTPETIALLHERWNSLILISSAPVRALWIAADWTRRAKQRALTVSHTHHVNVSQGQHCRTEHHVVFPPWGVQMEYSVHSSKCLRASGLCCQQHTLHCVCPHWEENAEIASESCLPGAVKNSPCRPSVLAGTGRQLLAWLPPPLISLFHLPPWIEVEGVWASDYLPEETCHWF